MKTETMKQLGRYLISESQHYSMNGVLNMRYAIQKTLEPWLGREQAKKWTIRVIWIVEGPLKSALY